MPLSDGEIVHVGDTALMVAACRALETARPDGFVRDPFAARLAGDRGMAIAHALPRLEMMLFGVGIRSRFMDEMVIDAIARHGIATVVSLGCGLDARPWRLELPPELRWIEVDLGSILEYKAALMASETPRCRLERRIADLNDAAERRAVYDAAGAAPTLMITEGLLMYLPAATVEALAAETAGPGGIRYWLSDITSPAFARMAGMDAYASIRSLQPEDYLDGLQILDLLRRHGWTTAARRSYVTDMSFAIERIQALGRSLAATGERQPAPPPPGDPTGVHLFSRA